MMVVISFLIQEFDLKIDLIALMCIFILIFCLGTGISFVMMESVMRPRLSRVRLQNGSTDVDDGGVGMKNSLAVSPNDGAPGGNEITKDDV